MTIWEQLRYILVGGEKPSDPADTDPNLLLERAQREMQELHVKNRERAVQAITQKNNLQALVDDFQKQVDALNAKRREAEDKGETELAAKLQREIDAYEISLDETRKHLVQAIETAEAVKVAIKREEEKIRQKTAEALALKAQWQTIQVQKSLLTSLAGINARIEDELSHHALQLRHAKNRRLVTRALVQKNNLAQMVADLEKRIDNLRQKAELARNRSDSVLENGLLREQEQYEATLVGTRDAYNRSMAVTERAMALLQEEEARLREMGVDPFAIPPVEGLEDDEVEEDTETGDFGFSRDVKRTDEQSAWLLLVAAVILVLVLLALWAILR